jgi:hypothetical protein
MTAENHRNVIELAGQNGYSGNRNSVPIAEGVYPMRVRRMVGWIVTVGAAWVAPSLIGPASDVSLGSVVMAQQATSGDVTFAKDIAPILQRSCQNCHRPNGVAPMSLVTYEEVRPWARAIKTRTGIGPRAGVMPPWYVEKNVGIQHYKDDPSLSDVEVAKIAKWVDSGAPLGNAADMPPAKVWADDTAWRIGKPDIIVKTKDVLVKANAPDWWGEIESVPVGLTEDRYVAAIHARPRRRARTGGGR